MRGRGLPWKEEGLDWELWSRWLCAARVGKDAVWQVEAWKQKEASRRPFIARAGLGWGNGPAEPSLPRRALCPTASGDPVYPCLPTSG